MRYLLLVLFLSGCSTIPQSFEVDGHKVIKVKHIKSLNCYCVAPEDLNAVVQGCKK